MKGDFVEIQALINYSATKVKRDFGENKEDSKKHRRDSTEKRERERERERRDFLSLTRNRKWESKE